MSATQILPQLWIGDKLVSQKRSFFDSKNISVVINCTKEVKFIDNFKNTYRLDIDDDLSDESIVKMYKDIYKIVDYIDEQIELGHNVLVHCHKGRQRSANIIAAYIMKYCSINYSAAMKYIQSKRPECFLPENNFLPVLKKIEKDLLELEEFN